MTGEAESQQAGTDTGVIRGIAGVVAANTSLVIAILVYMGWAYEASLYGYFHLSPIDLGSGIIEYLLRSLALFNPVIVILAVALIAVLATSGQVVAAARVHWPRARAVASSIAGALPAGLREAGRRPRQAARRAAPTTWAGRVLSRLLSGTSRSWSGLLRSPQAAQAVIGVALTGAALILAAVAGYIQVSTYLLLALLATGPLLLTRPHRQARRGRLPYVLATVVTAVTALWAEDFLAV